MKLPLAPERYDRNDQTRARVQIEQEDAKNHKRNADVELGKGRLVITSAGGKRFRLVVDETGVLSTVAM